MTKPITTKVRQQPIATDSDLDSEEVRHAPVVVAAAALACLLATACGRGRDPADDDNTAAEIGKVGDCYGESSTEPINCQLAHTAETVFVKDSPPGETSEALMPCREATAQYLGQDFNTRLDVRLWVAGDLSWYRCDVLLRESTKGGSGYQTLTGSLKGVLDSGASVDVQSCLSEPYDPGGDQVYVPCSESHIAQEIIQAPAIGTMDEKYPARCRSARDPRLQCGGVGRPTQRERAHRRGLLPQERRCMVVGRANRRLLGDGEEGRPAAGRAAGVSHAAESASGCGR